MKDEKSTANVQTGWFSVLYMYDLVKGGLMKKKGTAMSHDFEHLCRRI